MASTNGSFVNSAAAAADLGKEVTAYDVVIPLANTAQVVNPGQPFDAFTVYNLSSAYQLRGVITLSAGINSTTPSTTPAAERAFVVPPLGTFSLDFSDKTNDDATGSIGAIDSISFQALKTPAGSGLTSARVAPGALASTVVALINFVQA